MKHFCFQVLFGILLCFKSISFAQTPPINDDFENRIFLIGSSVSFSGTLANATIQSQEAIPSIATVINGSVWWSWTASRSGPATVEVLNFSTNAFKLGVIAIWHGTDFSTGLNLIAASGLDTGRHPFFTFSATSGTTYHLQVMGTNFSDFTLKITETNIPIIMIPPSSQSVLTNESTFFGVVAAGTPPLSYQWQYNGINLDGETFPLLSFDNLNLNQSGSYSVVISNAAGATISDAAILKVASTFTPPQLAADRICDGAFKFKIVGDAYRSYRIQSSTNLYGWSDEKSFPANFVYYRGREKNGVVCNQGNSFSVSEDAQAKFYRPVVYSAPNEVCINNLKKIRFAQEIWTLENGQGGLSALTGSDLEPYFKNGLPVCPLGPPECVPCSYAIQTADRNPLCQISLEHVLEEPEL